MFKLIINNEEISFDSAVYVKDIIPSKDYYGVILNNKIHDLNYKIQKSGKLSFIHKDSDIGKSMYIRTLDFIFICAVKILFPEAKVSIRHSFSKGQYCTIDKSSPLTIEEISLIKDKIDEIISKKEPIIRTVTSKEEAIRFFENEKLYHKAQLLADRNQEKCSVYSCMNIYNYFYGVMLPDTSYITEYQCLPYQEGVWLCRKASTPLIDSPKVFNVFKRFESFGQKYHIETIVDLNNCIKNNEYTSFVSKCERRYDKDLERIANKVKDKNGVKLILMSGPSSAGKTTTSLRLSDKLSALGYNAIAISMDDFFKERIETPKLPDGSYDYENITSIDMDLFQKCMNQLINQESCVLPSYDFVSGTKSFDKDPIILNENDILIVEGLHALNPKSSDTISDDRKFKIYLNALTHLNIDQHNYISTTDYRLIRRMTRDKKFRNRSIVETIQSWPAVMYGEDNYIYPYQEEADVVFNSSLDYELPIFKSVLMNDLKAMNKDCDEYQQALKISQILNFFIDADMSVVPHNSLLREFIGKEKS